MSKGKNRVIEFGGIGMSQSETAPDWGFIYKISLVKDPGWNVGDHVRLPDGREFVYSKSSAACISGQGCEFTSTGLVPITTLTTAQAVGDKELIVPAATHDTVTEDSVRGGYVLIYDGVGNNVQFRQIIGNTAAITGVAFTVYLDGPLSEAIVANTSKVEVFANPYSALRTGTSVALAKAGIPAVKVTAASTYFWCQIRKFCWAAPQSGITGKTVGACWRHDGSLDTPVKGICNATGDNGGDANVAAQYAGHTVCGSADGNGPLFNLQD